MMLYKKIDIDNFEIIREEILNLCSQQISQNLRFWDIRYIDFLKNTPTFINYISNKLYKIPVLFRFYNTPPQSWLPPHLDGMADSVCKIGFNIPLLNTENTYMRYYDTPEDNIKIAYKDGFTLAPVRIIEDKSKLVPLDSIVIDKPTLLRTDITHQVDNYNNSYRLVLCMKLEGNSFEEVFKFNTGS